MSRAPRARGWARCLGLVVLGLAAAGLPAAAREREREDDPAPPPGASARGGAGEGLSVLDAVPGARYRLELHGPQRLRELLLRHLDLARYQHPAGPGGPGLVAGLAAGLHPSADGGTAAVEDDPARAISPAELARLLALAPAQAQALLETEGHFQAGVQAEREDPPDGAGPPTLRLRITPGPQARIAAVDLQLVGALAELGGRGDAEGQRAQRRWQRLQQRWALSPGEPFTQAAWAGAKTALLTALRSTGYPAASLVETAAEVDAPRGQVRLRLRVDSGPLFRVGRIRVEGLQHTPPQAALHVRPFALGEVYSERLLLDYQEALQRVGLYQGVAVELDPDPAQADPATVVLRLREQKLQSATLSLGYSSNTGPRLGGDYTHRRPFGQGWTATARLNLGLRERDLGFELLSDPRPKNYRDLLSLRSESLDAAGALTRTQRLRIGRSQDSDPIERLVYLELNRSAVETASTRSDARSLGGNYAWSRREVNNLLFPTRGWAVSLEAGGGYAVDAGGDRGPYTRLLGRGLLYLPLDGLGGDWFVQLRGEAAQVLKRDALDVPDALLFRAGGDDSVRGYAFQTLGVDRDGATVGGEVLATASAELLHRFDGRWRDWYGAAFVDAGQADRSWRGFRPDYGYGLGLRWRSPIGPLRVDLAYGEAVSSLRLHVNVGVRF